MVPLPAGISMILRSWERGEFEMDDEAQVGIIAAILLLGVAMIVVSFFLTYYVPQMTRDSEKAHIDNVVSSFAQMHDGLAQQVLNRNMGAIFPVTMPLGSGGAFLGMGGVSGSLSVSDQSYFYVNSTQSVRANGSVIYQPSLVQLIPQTYTYELGSVVLAQGDRALIRNDPLIDIQRDQSTISMNLTMISLSTMEITSRGGTGAVTLNFYIDYVMPVELGDQRSGTVVFDFHTPNAVAWRRYFTEYMEPVGAEFYSLDSELNSADRFYMTLKNVDLENSNVMYAIVRVSIGD